MLNSSALYVQFVTSVITSRGERLFALSDIYGDIELYTYSESANFSLSYDVYNSISP
jgi:hypothetical protein